MFLVDKPFTRLNLFLEDGGWRWSKIATKKTTGFLTTEPLVIEPTPNSKPKQSDARWRRNWEWVLLESTGDRVCRPVFFNTVYDREVNLLRKPITTNYFALRIGPMPIRVLTMDGDGRLHTPKPVLDMHKNIARYKISRQSIVHERKYYLDQVRETFFYVTTGIYPDNITCI